MKIGYVYGYNTPHYFYYLVNTLAQTYGIETFYFKASDLDIKTKTINARCPDNNGCKSIQKHIPFLDSDRAKKEH